MRVVCHAVAQNGKGKPRLVQRLMGNPHRPMQQQLPTQKPTPNRTQLVMAYSRRLPRLRGYRSQPRCRCSGFPARSEIPNDLQHQPWSKAR
jgi:hypothetical protein